MISSMMSRLFVRMLAVVVASITWVGAADMPPTVMTVASATPAYVTAKTTTLTIKGADDGGAPSLLYAWTSSGPEAVTFSATNGTSAATSLSATFSASGVAVDHASVGMAEPASHLHVGHPGE